MTINVDTSASSSSSSQLLLRRPVGLLVTRMCPVCLRLTCSIKNRPKFVQSSVPRLALPCPCLSLSSFPSLFPPFSPLLCSCFYCVQISWCLRAMRGMPAAASFKFQLAFNDLMPSLSLSFNCSARYAQPLPERCSSCSSWHSTRFHVGTSGQRTSGRDIGSSGGSGYKSQCSGLAASAVGTLTLWPAWLRSGAAHALPARRSLQAVG